MRKPHDILNTHDTPATQADDPLRHKFEALHQGVIGQNCYDRVVYQNGKWKYLDASMNSRWQGFQLAHAYGPEEFEVEDGS